MAPKESRIAKIVEYEDGKLWFHKRSDTITIGLTADGLESIGTPDRIHLPEAGEAFDKDDEVLEISGSDNSITVYTPAGGTIADINEALKADIAILNEDPIDEGWLVKIEMQDPSDLAEYL